MKSSKHIEHKGVVSSVNEGRIKVDIQPESACSACHAKSQCGVSNTDKKIIDVYDYSTSYNVGDEVKVALKESLGFKALFIGYVIPFLVVVTVLILMLELTGNELKAGVVALFALAPYYLVVYKLRNKLEKTFSFSLVK